MLPAKADIDRYKQALVTYRFADERNDMAAG